MKILVIQKKFMGDVLISSVIFLALKKKFPNAEFHYLIQENYKDVVLNHPNIHNLIFFDKFFLKTLKKVRKEKYDVIVDSYSKTETAGLAFLSGAKITVGFFKNYTQFFYTNSVHRKPAESKLLTTAIEHRLQLLEPLQIPISEIKPKIFLTENERKNAKILLQNFGINPDKKLIMISLFGSNEAKSYPFMNQIVEIIAKNSDAQILCNYLPSQKDDFENIYNALSDFAKAKIIKNFDTKNLREFIAILSFCDANIGNEGGSTNISKALNVPTFSIFAPFVAKDGWNWFDDDERNVSVHLHDYLPESSAFDDFKPEFFETKLINFLKENNL